MAIAALPAYFPQDQLKHASPALRFGMYLRIWGVDCRSQHRSWDYKDTKYEVRGANRVERPVQIENKGEALRFAAGLNPGDRDCIKALRSRQADLFAAATAESGRFSIDALAIAPFTTGLGIEHPLENGFAFLNPYGVPYLPGSSVKGVVRAAARELAAGEWGETHGWCEELIVQLFGPEPSRGAQDAAQSGALQFWDVLPEIPGDRLMVEIMTPHQGHYYHASDESSSGDSASPHDSGQPNPMVFLTVPPESKLAFYVQCDLQLLCRRSREPFAAQAASVWRELLTAAFEHAFEWLGFGAKTAVGYGAMARDQKAERARAELTERIEREQSRLKQVEAAVQGLPPDAAELKRLVIEQGWGNNHGALVSGLTAWLERTSKPSPQAVGVAREVVDRAFPGLLADPDATQGKKNKPKFKDPQRKLARTILRLEAGLGE